MITDDALYGLDWSVKDWLIYTALDQNIYKIKSNGDSLTQITCSGDYNRYPKWDPNGNRIAYNTQTGSFSHFIISDERGVPTDTLEELQAAGQWSWIDGHRICYLIADTAMSHTSNIKYYNLDTDEILFLHQLVRNNSQNLLVLNTVSLPEENSIIWCAVGTIGKTDLATGTFELLRERLLHERYEYLTVRPGGQQFLFNKRSVHYVGNCRFDSDYDFILINKDGSDQQKVVLP